ncbi:hypothetical protein GYN07_02410 [Rhizobium leguminosarum bv. viciae 248]|uniref:hypothetical protein n=1 Tax=Rhizobium leguminosarum TaxID=384 RepID=UPI0003692BE6|nr:hypothetical protein [Rhizobium leguminosarum]NKM64352.1 hypothetical protein [Rhizobium leguminosarum bv. viciae]QHW23255.1 hypothetical protein GYN07_02410 [Rhizobium leguminosarum bv. viciae 248]
MSNPEARLSLATLVAERMAEVGIARAEFMNLTGFTTESSFGSYLAGFSKLHLWQVPLIAKTLELDERRLLLMCLEQNHDDWCMDLFRRHI